MALSSRVWLLACNNNIEMHACFAFVSVVTYSSTMSLNLLVLLRIWRQMRRQINGQEKRNSLDKSGIYILVGVCDFQVLPKFFDPPDRRLQLPIETTINDTTSTLVRRTPKAEIDTYVKTWGVSSVHHFLSPRLQSSRWIWWRNRWRVFPNFQYSKVNWFHLWRASPSASCRESPTQTTISSSSYTIEGMTCSSNECDHELERMWIDQRHIRKTTLAPTTESSAYCCTVSVSMCNCSRRNYGDIHRASQSKILRAFGRRGPRQTPVCVWDEIG